MRLRCLLVGAAVLCGQPASATGGIDWTDANLRVTNALDPGSCASVRFSTTTRGQDSELLDVRGHWISLQSEGDAAGSGASAGALFACTSTDGDRDGTPDRKACAPLDLAPGGTNRLDGATARGTLTPMTVAGWIYVTPDATTIQAGEVFEVLVCAVR
jgi:hypothetical protein